MEFVQTGIFIKKREKYVQNTQKFFYYDSYLSPYIDVEELSAETLFSRWLIFDKVTTLLHYYVITGLNYQYGNFWNIVHV